MCSQLSLFALILFYVSSVIKSQSLYIYDENQNTYNCNSSANCIINCQNRGCDNNYINSSQSLSLKIIGCDNNNCNNMTIYCPNPTNLNDFYECQIKHNVSTNSSSIFNLHIYAQSLDKIEIDFDCIRNSIFYPYNNINSSCLIAMDGLSCSNYSHMEQNTTTTFSKQTKIDGIQLPIDEFILFAGLLILLMIFCFCCVGITIIGTFCWFRLQHEKKAIDNTIHELIKKQKSIHQKSIHQTYDENIPIIMPQTIDRFRVASKSDMIDSDNEADDDDDDDDQQMKEIELAMFSKKQRSNIKPLKPLRVISITIDSDQPDSPNMIQEELSPIPSSPVSSTVITHNTINTNTTGSSVPSSQISSASPITPGAPSVPKEQKLKFKLPKAVTPGQWM